MLSITRRELISVALVLALPMTLYLLMALAQRQLNSHLRQEAAHALALAANGDTPYLWSFLGSSDLVAGRAFGVDTIAFHNGTLELKAPSHNFELGLPLARSIDLRRYNRLRIQFEIESPGTLVLVTRKTLDAPEQISQAISLQPKITLPELALDQLNWKGSSATGDKNAESVAMLRLRWQLAPGSLLRLHSVRLSRGENAPQINLEQPPRVIEHDEPPTADNLIVYSLPISSNFENLAIERLNQVVTPPALPLILLPERGRVEEQLSLRDRIYSILPAAIVIPTGQLTATITEAREEKIQAKPKVDTLVWGSVMLYALVLIGLRLRPPRNSRLRALLEAGFAIAGLLWLVVGGHFELHIRGPAWVMIAVILIFILSLSRPVNAPRMHWLGTLRSWSLALAVIGVAVGLAAAWHRPDAEIDLGSFTRFIRYLIWALAQQYLICVVMAERLQLTSRDTSATVYLCALVFALLHTPNASLMLITFIGEIAWCTIYLRERTLLPIAFSHAVSATILITTLPINLLRSAEVSARFFF